MVKILISAMVLAIVLVDSAVIAQSPSAPKPAQADVAAKNRAVLGELPF